MRGLGLLLGLAAGCGGGGAGGDFLWGSATAGFQVDMGCPTLPAIECHDAASDWYQWVTTPEIVRNANLHVTGETVNAGPGMWELFEEDVARMKADGHNSYRFSLEWSRLFPFEEAAEATTVDELDAYARPAVVQRYRDMLRALRDAGIEPLVTVNHYVLPLWVHDGVACHNNLQTCSAKGWVDAERTTRLIALFAGWAGATFGDEVDTWCTLNEPFATTLAGYLQPGEDRSAPPGRSFDGDSVVITLRAQIEAHAAMVDALREHDQHDANRDGADTFIGIVMNMVDIHPKDAAREADVEAAVRADHIYHDLFLSAVTTGDWDDDLDGSFDRQRSELAGRLDWVGVNYYNRMDVAWLGGFKPLGELVPAFDFAPEFSWDPHPEGLEPVLKRAGAYGLPVIVTENGTPHLDQASDVLRGHVHAMERAVADGVDVRGYHVWSFIDNYEWNHGMDMRFGLYTFDPVTKQREKRPVADVYAGIIAAGGAD